MELNKTKAEITKYSFALRSIDIDNQVVSLYCEDSKEIFSLPIQSLVLDNSILDRIYPLDAARIGYRYGIAINTGCLITCHSSIPQILKAGELNIVAIRRDKKLVIEMRSKQFIFTKSSLEVYKSDLFMEKFSPSQAMYIGYLVSA